MIKVRSVSDLRKVDFFSDEDILHMSRHIGDGKYSSYALPKQVLFDSIIDSVSLSVAEKYDFGDVSSVQELKDTTEQLSSVMRVEHDDIKSVNTAVFDNTPKSKSVAVLDDDIPNMKQVRDIVTDNGEYISPASYVNVYPKNYSGQTQWDDRMYMWHIDNGQNDTSRYVDENGLSEPDGKEIKETGYLTIYGWLASNEQVTAQEAWVGLFAKVRQQGGTKEDWIALQIQPWIIGRNSQVLQYVGFNVPVHAGLRLKIMTGFNVNGFSSGTNTGRSLLFNDVGVIPNTFVGYVFQNT